VLQKIVLTLLIFFQLRFLSLAFGQEGAGDGESLGGLPKLAIGLYEENYIFPFYRSVPNPLDTNQSNELKYQFSIKFTPFQFGNWSYILAYSQKSFWQIFSGDTSRPFRETNYNPETLFRYKPGAGYWDIGYEHESNGESDPVSRSWDRLYTRFGIVTPRFKMSLKLWYIFLGEFNGPDYEERKRPKRDYMGNFEFDIGAMLGTILVKGYCRYNPETGYGYAQGMTMWRFHGSLLFGFTYARGYGDSLRSYQINHETYGVGFLMNP
jgi:phospholipase A1